MKRTTATTVTTAMTTSREKTIPATAPPLIPTVEMKINELCEGLKKGKKIWYNYMSE